MCAERPNETLRSPRTFRQIKRCQEENAELKSELRIVKVSPAAQLEGGHPPTQLSLLRLAQLFRECDGRSR